MQEEHTVLQKNTQCTSHVSICSQLAQPSTFNDVADADTTFGQQSNAYDTAAMTRRMSVETSPLLFGDGSAYSTNVQHLFRSFMGQRRASIGADEADIVKHSLQGAVRLASTTPNNSPSTGLPVSMAGNANSSDAASESDVRR
jgi:hypothetical protein